MKIHEQIPARGRAARGAASGFTLVELMVSLLIVGIVMLGWWRIMNATSPYREAQRRAAVEVAAGMLDVLETGTLASGKRLKLALDQGGLWKEDAEGKCHPFPPDWFPPESPIRYTLEVVPGTGEKDWMFWSSEMKAFISARSRWLTVRLYDSENRYAEGKPFATLSQLVYAQSL